MQIEIINSLLDYKKGISLMEGLILKKEEKILILQHNDVFTYGKGHVYLENDLLNNIPVLKSNRGGDLTYHGPGQIVCYFIIDYKMRGIFISDFINSLENFLIKWLLSEFNIIAKKSPLGRGIWINNKKVCFIGLNASNGFISHGISINYDVDLNYFQLIKPCNLNVEIGNLKGYIKKKRIDAIKKSLATELKKLSNDNFTTL